MKYEVADVRLVENLESKRKAYVSIKIDDSLMLNDVCVMEGRFGLYAAMPQKQVKDKNGETRYQNIYNPITKEARCGLIDTVLCAYKAKLLEENIP